jgi:tetratricopeptide (TPR) repeat protein
MKNIFLIILFFSSFYSISQTKDDYINGYKDGFRSGYCQNELQCSAPIPNSRSIFIGDRPLQYPAGYAQGLEDGKEKRINDNKNKLTSTSTTTNSNVNNDYWEARGIEDNSTISAEEYIERGVGEFTKNNFIEAINEFTKAIRISSENDDNIQYGYFYRANSKAFIGDFAGALKDIELAKQNGWPLRIQGYQRRWRKNKL